MAGDVLAGVRDLQGTFLRIDPNSSLMSGMCLGLGPLVGDALRQLRRSAPTACGLDMMSLIIPFVFIESRLVL